MDIQSIDKHLLENGVKFLPWIGKDYEYGLSYDKDGKMVLGEEGKPGRKILVLGESHYVGDDGVDDFKNGDNEDWADFTRNVVNDYLGDTIRERWMNTFIKFERSLYGDTTDRMDSKNIWNHLVFYNYIQVPLTGPRLVAKHEDYTNASEPFFDLLSTLKPDIIIVWGNRLYHRLPSDNCNLGINGNDGGSINVDGYANPTWIYELKNGHKILAICVYHPASGYSWDYWNKVIKKGVK